MRRGTSITFEGGPAAYHNVLIGSLSRAETRVAQGCVYPSSVDVLLEVIAAVGKRKVVEVRVRRDPLTEMGVETVLYLPFDQITLSFNSFRGYRVPRHSIPPLMSVVDADLSIA